MIDWGLADWVAEAVEPLGRVTRKRLFGGAALYCDGIAFAILAFDALWLKADAETDAEWDAVGAPRFTVERDDGKVQSMNYRRAPDETYDDADELRRWARLAIEAGQRAAVKPKRRSK
ncbi:TfoX/Sxy family protein [Sphingomonas cannabina]|uniref:TfoX/Sxy family protein n=1 Tax=Sphingomonas cannabina TaxID=2899123 RepID=UPI001F3D1457|nr:TfoX/Sxy family protein [Sphingomonas cannabina]UIJ46462.1 TfoX/Sxy family protein [Sphingomonas cannabina]